MSDTAYWKQRNHPVPTTQREADIQRTILEYLELHRIFHYRANTGAVKFSGGNGKHYFVRFGKKGMADIVCCVNGRFVAIEVKTEDGEQTLAQREWQEGVERAGGVYVLARRLEDVTAVVERNA